MFRNGCIGSRSTADVHCSIHWHLDGFLLRQKADHQNSCFLSWLKSISFDKWSSFVNIIAGEEKSTGLGKFVYAIANFIHLLQMKLFYIISETDDLHPKIK